MRQHGKIDNGGVLRLQIRADADLVELADETVILRPIGIDLALENRVLDILVLELGLLCLEFPELGPKIGDFADGFLVLQPDQFGNDDDAIVELAFSSSIWDVSCCISGKPGLNIESFCWYSPLSSPIFPRILSSPWLLSTCSRLSPRPASICWTSRP